MTEVWFEIGIAMNVLLGLGKWSNTASPCLLLCLFCIIVECTYHMIHIVAGHNYSRSLILVYEELDLVVVL